MKKFISLSLFFGIFCVNAQQVKPNTVNDFTNKAVFTSPPKYVPTDKVPDAPLAGNGDIGITMGGTPDKLCFYIGKNDFWNAYPYPPAGGIALPGGLNIEIDRLKGGTYYAEQVMDKAQINAKFSNNNLSVELTSQVLANNNTILIELTANMPCQARLNLWTPESSQSEKDEGNVNGCNWVTRSFDKAPLIEWPSQVVMALSLPGSTVKNYKFFDLVPGRKVTIAIVVYTNHDRRDWKEAAIKEVRLLTLADIGIRQQEHQRWWTAFWKQSHVSLGDPVLEKYYYASQYLFACTSRSEKFAPGLWGCFITRDSTAWSGDYHLNYNYQAPYWAAFSSNQINLTGNFEKPLLEYMSKGKAHAKSLLNNAGIYYPVGIGPKGLTTARWPASPADMKRIYGKNSNKIDNGYMFLGQKTNAVFSVGNMMMHFYSTYDGAYARLIYPYILECANFWEGFLKKKKSGRYVVIGDHFNEQMPSSDTTGGVDKNDGDYNSTLSLGLIKMLFKGIIDISKYLKIDANRQTKWYDIFSNLSEFPLGDAKGRVSLKDMEKGPGNTEVGVYGLNRVSIHGLILPGGVCGPITTPSFNQILLQDIDHWKDHMTKPGEWANTLGNGIESCFPAAARIGYNPDDLIRQLKDRIALQSYPNLWITQAGGGIETLSAVPLTVNEMLMQSYEGTIRVFPNWNPRKDASFEQLRAYGAFLVSSNLKNGVVGYIKILSEKGNQITLQSPWMKNKISVLNISSKKPIPIIERNGHIIFDTKAWETYIIKVI